MRFSGLGSWVERRAALASDDVALVAGDGRAFTYGSLADVVNGSAALLREREIGAGDRVAYHGGNQPAALISLFATTRIGAIWVPIHPQRPEDQAVSILEDAKPALVIRSSPDTHPATAIAEIDGEEIESLPASDGPATAEIEPDDIAILAYTSGTTGPPRGATLTHANITSEVEQMVQACAVTSTDAALGAAPFTRMGGLGVIVLPTIHVGGRVVVPPTTDGSALLETIEGQRVTVVFANPDHLESMRSSPRWPASELSVVRTGVVGGGLVPDSLLRAYLDRGITLRHGYGLSEASPVVSILDEADAVTHADSVGKALPLVEIRCVRPDGTACEPGEPGEWEVRGPNVCAGYWHGDSVTTSDGWFPTGDVGTIDADGYLRILDRASSAMTIGGTVVYPATIERAVYGMAGVLDAGAVELGGRIVLAIVEQPDARVDLIATTGELVQRLTPAERPAVVRIVGEIPRNQAGKIIRSELRRRLATSATAR